MTVFLNEDQILNEDQNHHWGSNPQDLHPWVTLHSPNLLRHIHSVPSPHWQNTPLETKVTSIFEICHQTVGKGIARSNQLYMIWKGKADIWFVNLTCKRDQGWFCCIHHFRYRAYPPHACRPPPQSAPSPGNILCERLLEGRCTSTETKIANKQNRGRWSRNSMTLSCLLPELVFFACLRVVLAEILLFRDLIVLNGAFLVNSTCFIIVSIRPAQLENSLKGRVV